MLATLTLQDEKRLRYFSRSLSFDNCCQNSKDSKCLRLYLMWINLAGFYSHRTHVQRKLVLFTILRLVHWRRSEVTVGSYKWSALKCLFYWGLDTFLLGKLEMRQNNSTAYFLNFFWGGCYNRWSSSHDQPFG